MAVELWLVWERFVAVRQVMDWRGSQGDASSGTVMSGAEWSGSQGFAGHVTAERGEAGQGSRGLARRGEVWYVAANRGMAGQSRQSRRVKAERVQSWIGEAVVACDGKSSQGGAGCGGPRYGTARQLRRVMVFHGTVWRGLARRVKAVGATYVMALRDEARPCGSRQSRHGQHPQNRKDAICRHLQTSIHIGADSISKFPRKS